MGGLESGSKGGDTRRPELSVAGALGAGQYHPFAKLGEGGMAQVFLALARGPVGVSKLVVLKRIRARYARDEAIVTMFIDEARLAARLGHPNVIHTYGLGKDAGLYFIAMEYLEGQPYHRVLSEVHRTKRAVRPALWMRIVSDALAGLQYAHELRDYDGTPLEIVHRDVSPHNVLVTYDGQVKLVDFGIAKAAVSRAQTDAGVLKGKIAYMSPEQARGGRIDRRSDLFAMGIVLWEAIAGQPLYRHEYAATTLHKLLNEAPPRLSSVVDGVDPDLDALVAKSLAHDPDDRFRSAQEMRDALEGWIEARGEVVRPAEIGRLVSDLFRDVREAVRGQIQSYMTGMGTDSVETGKHVFVSGWSSGDTRLPTIEMHRSGESESAVVRGSGDGTEEPARRGSVAWLVAATLAGAVLAAGVIGARFVDGHAGHDASASIHAPAPVLASAIPLPPPPPEVPPPTASTREAPPVVAPLASPPGFLSFDTYPWARVSERGRPLGDTPLIRVALSPGVHVLALDNPELSIHQTYAVTIRSGESVARRLGLE